MAQLRNIDPTHPENYDETFRNQIEAGFWLDFPRGIDTSDPTHTPKRLKWVARIRFGDLYRWMCRPGSLWRRATHAVGGRPLVASFWPSEAQLRVLARDGQF